MARILLAVALAALLAGSLEAGEIYIPSSTSSNPASGTCMNLPWIANQGEIRYQMFAPATVLGTKPLMINELAFAPCSIGVFSATQCEIRLAHLTGARLTTVFATNLEKDITVVYSGALKWSYNQDQWSDVGLTAPFAYNGVDNVVVEIRYQGGQGGPQVHGDAVVVSYVVGQGAYNAPNANPFTALVNAKFRLTYAECLITGSGSTKPGGTIQLALSAMTDPKLPYQVGTSLGTGPIKIDTRTLGLGLDPLLVGCVSGWFPGVFQGYAGVLDGNGLGTAKILIPNNTGFVGVRLHTAYVTLSPTAPSGVKSISNTFTFTIQ